MNSRHSITAEPLALMGNFPREDAGKLGDDADPKPKFYANYSFDRDIYLGFGVLVSVEKKRQLPMDLIFEWQRDPGFSSTSAVSIFP